MKTRTIIKFAVVFYFTTSLVKALDKTASKAVSESNWYKEFQAKHPS